MGGWMWFESMRRLGQGSLPPLDGLRCLAHWCACTQVDLQRILELQIISNIVMETAMLWGGSFPFPTERWDWPFLPITFFQWGCLAAEDLEMMVSLTSEQLVMCAGRLWKSILAPLDLCPCRFFWQVSTHTKRFLETALSRMPLMYGRNQHAVKSCKWCALL